jgi:hypothetical protein
MRETCILERSARKRTHCWRGRADRPASGRSLCRPACRTVFIRTSKRALSFRDRTNWRKMRRVLLRVKCEKCVFGLCSSRLGRGLSVAGRSLEGSKAKSAGMEDEADMCSSTTVPTRGSTAHSCSRCWGTARSRLPGGDSKKMPPGIARIPGGRQVFAQSCLIQVETGLRSRPRRRFAHFNHHGTCALTLRPARGPEEHRTSS